MAKVKIAARKSVTILCRGDSLEKNMSRYLEAIAFAPVPQAGA